MDTTWHDVGGTGEFVDGEVRAKQAGDQAVAVFRLGDEIFALKDLCTHGNAKLSDGYLEDGCIECPLHQGQFDIRTGAPRCAPVTEAVRSFPIRVVAGRVEVSVAPTSCTEAPAPEIRKLKTKVVNVVRAAPDVAVLRLRSSAIDKLSYKAGQYVDVLLAGGERRSYSMATSSTDCDLELHIRHLPGGLFTDHVFSRLEVDHELELEGPCGNFYLREGDMPIILLASGTGFAPIKALVEEAIEQGLSRPMRLYWGGRKAADLYMDALCKRWSELLPWFEYVPVLSDPPAEWEGRKGFVHCSVLEDFPALDRHEVYACGAPVVIESAQRDFGKAGLLPAHFYADSFISKADTK